MNIYRSFDAGKDGSPGRGTVYLSICERVSGDEQDETFTSLVSTLLADVNEAPDEGADLLRKRLEQVSEQKEAKEKEIADLLKEWEKAAMISLAYERAVALSQYSLPASTRCVWTTIENDGEYSRCDKCSNTLYEATVRMFPTWSIQRGDLIAVQSSVALVQPISRSSFFVKPTTEKRFTVGEASAALDYFESQKQRFSKKYFVEENPVVPHEHERLFTLDGIRFPQYRYED